MWFKMSSHLRLTGTTEFGKLQNQEKSHQITVNSSRNVLPDISPTDCCGESTNADCPAHLDSSSTVETVSIVLAPMVSTCDHPRYCHLQWFRMVTARCAYTFCSWPLHPCTWTIHTQKKISTYGPKGGEKWSRTPIHQEVHGPIGSEWWSQHTSKYRY